MSSDNINPMSLTGAKDSAQAVVRDAERLEHLISYLRKDHVGMIRGDGDLTRYMFYLIKKVSANSSGAVHKLDVAGVPDDLPF